MPTQQLVIGYDIHKYRDFILLLKETITLHDNFFLNNKCFWNHFLELKGRPDFEYDWEFNIFERGYSDVRGVLGFGISSPFFGSEEIQYGKFISDTDKIINFFNGIEIKYQVTRPSPSIFFGELQSC